MDVWLAQFIDRVAHHKQAKGRLSWALGDARADKPLQGLWPWRERARGYTRTMSSNGHTPRDEATFTVKAGLAEMLKGGVIMDVVTPEEAKIAEDAGAAAVMALERVPSDIRRDGGGVARMSDPEMITSIQAAVTIPVMAKALHRPLRRGSGT